MNCHEAEQLFDAYLDGELSESLRLEFDAHRLSCPLCEQKLAILEACAHTLASDHDVPALSDDFTERVMAELRQKPVPIRRLRRRWVAAAAIANVAAAVAFLLYLALPRAGQQPAVVSATGEPQEVTSLDEALQDPSGVDLYDYITSRVEQARKAKQQVAQDLASLPRYALNLRLWQDGFDPTRPLTSLLEALFPQPPAEPSGDDASSGQVSF